MTPIVNAQILGPNPAFIGEIRMIGGQTFSNSADLSHIRAWHFH